MKKEQRYIPDEMDSQFAELFYPLREEINAYTESSVDDFTSEVMKNVPRRDISLWIIMAFTLMGVGVVYLVMGYEATVSFYYSLMDFFTSIGAMQMPSVSSFVSVAALILTMGLVGYGLLNTSDYQTYQ